MSNDRVVQHVRVGVPGSLVGVAHVIDGRRANAKVATDPDRVVTALLTGDAQRIEVRCDRCGFRVDGISGSRRHWDAVWALVAGTGWTGSPAAEGPHACPDCAGQGTGRVDRLALTRAHSSTRWRAEIHLLSGATIVELHGDLDVSVRDEFRGVLDRAGAVSRNVVLDLAGVPLIDSTALGLLVRAHQRARHRGGWVCLVAPSRFVLAVLHTMRLEPVFPIFEDCGQAVEWLTMRPRRARASD